MIIMNLRFRTGNSDRIPRDAERGCEKLSIFHSPFSMGFDYELDYELMNTDSMMSAGTAGASASAGTAATGMTPCFFIPDDAPNNECNHQDQ